MRPIRNPPPPDIGPNSSVDAVINLQDVLLLLIEKGIIQLPDPERQELSNALANERQESAYRDVTAKLVTIFREQHGLEPGEIVDEHTAEALNSVLQELGAFDEPVSPAESRRVVSGQVTRADEQPFAGGTVRAFHEAVRLGEDTTDGEGRYTIRYDPLPGLSTVQLRVGVYDTSERRLQSSEVIPAAKAVEMVDLLLPLTLTPSEQRRLEGRIVFQNGLPAENLTLRLYRLDFDGIGKPLKEEKVGEDAVTRELGLYTLPFDLRGTSSGLEVRAVVDDVEAKLCKPLYNLGTEARVIVNLVAPPEVQGLAPEYQRLTADLTPHVGELKNLVEVRENTERQDLSALNEPRVGTHA